MFKVGDKIVYPMHGAGTITDIEEKEILGSVKSYYILKMPVSELKISIPVDKINDMGIRPIVDTDKAKKMSELILEETENKIKNWNKRYKTNLNKLKSGKLDEVCIVYRDLYILDAQKGLSMIEKKILNASKKMLVSEIALALDKDPDELTKQFEKEIYDRHIKNDS
ncbi:MAG: CarD family transcriptional regulator [Tissierellia bacterium]|nr:CarD family transcriptional regulator [Tissierellia bacterium]